MGISEGKERFLHKLYCIVFLRTKINNLNVAGIRCAL